MTTRTASPRTSQPTAKVAKLHRHDDGRICAQSSDGVTRYAVVNRPDGSWSCTCPAGQHGRTCYHVKTAMVRFGGFFPRPVHAVIGADPDPEPSPPAAPVRPTPASSLLAALATCDRPGCEGGCTRDHARPAPPAFPVCLCDNLGVDPACPFHGNQRPARRACACSLYDVPDCRACRQSVAAA